MATFVLESILRSLLMAATVWLGIKLLRVSHVLVQKVAWGLVLLAAFAMPFLMHWQSTHRAPALVIPVHRTLPAVVATPPVLPAPEVLDAAPLTPVLNSVPMPISSVPITMQDQPLAPAAIWRPAQLVRYVLPAYLIVSGILLLRLLIGLVIALRIWSTAEPASPILEPRASVRISASIQSPVTVGSGIVLPASYTEWSRAKLRLVLAHERSHVRQKDFHIQLLASVYAALVWFSPLGWWLKHKLADLGEALSDRAALLEADDNSSYAEVLLEFAAMPRRGFIGATAAVGMARSSNIQRRIDRILNERNFSRAFPGGRRHAILTALLVPIALVAATAIVRVEAVEAAPMQISATQPVTPITAPAIVPVAAAPAVINASAIQAAAPRSVTPPAPPPPPAPEAVPAPEPPPSSDAAPEPEPLPAPEPRQVPVAPSADAATPREHVHSSYSSHSSSYSSSSPGSYSYSYSDGGRNSFAIVSGDTGHVTGSGDFGEAFQRVRREVKGDFIWVEHDGKSYVITDPALIAQSREFFRPEGEIGLRQAALGHLQADIGRQQAEMSRMQVEVKIPPIDMSKAMAELQSAMTALQSSQGQLVSQKSINEIVARLGNIQGKLVQLEVNATLKQSGLGSKQGALGEKEADIGKQQAELGKEQERIAKDAMQKMNSLLDKALSDGKAKPLN